MRVRSLTLAGGNMSGGNTCVDPHMMFSNQHVGELQKAYQAIKETRPKRDHKHVKDFLLHAARIRSYADQLLQEGLITQGQAIVDGCCGLGLSKGETTPPSKKTKKAA